MISPAADASSDFASRRIWLAFYWDVEVRAFCACFAHRLRNDPRLAASDGEEWRDSRAFRGNVEIRTVGFRDSNCVRLRLRPDQIILDHGHYLAGFKELANPILPLRAKRLHPSSSVQPSGSHRLPQLTNLLDALGFETKDNRAKGGALWVMLAFEQGQAINAILRLTYKIQLRFARNGGKASGYKGRGGQKKKCDCRKM